LTHLVNLHCSDSKDSRKLAIKIKKLYNDQQFLKDIGLGRNKSCAHCKPKQACTPLSSDNLINLLVTSKGYCRSCNIHLSLNESTDATGRQKINAFQVWKYASSNCTTVEDFVKKKVSIMCKACSTLSEVLYLHDPLFNHYRKIMFHRMTWKE